MNISGIKGRNKECTSLIVKQEFTNKQPCRAWGGDLIVSVVPGVGHLTDLVLPGEGIFESFFARRGDIYLTVDSDEKD